MNTIRRIAGVITEVYGTFTGTPAAGLATYDAYGFFDMVSGEAVEMKLLALAPKRAAVGVDMIPAQKNDPCDIMIGADNVPILFALTEQIPVDEACA